MCCSKKHLEKKLGLKLTLPVRFGGCKVLREKFRLCSLQTNFCILAYSIMSQIEKNLCRRCRRPIRRRLFSKKRYVKCQKSIQQAFKMEDRHQRHMERDLDRNAGIPSTLYWREQFTLGNVEYFDSR